MGTARGTRSRARGSSVAQVLLRVVAVPAGVALAWLAFLLVQANPLEEVFANSMVDFVPGPLIPYLIYAALGAGGLYLAGSALTALVTLAREARARARRRKLRR